MKSRRLKIEDYGNYHFVIDLFTLRDAWFPCVFLADSFNHSHGFLVQRGMQAAQEFGIDHLAFLVDGELHDNPSCDMGFKGILWIFQR